MRIAITQTASDRIQEAIISETPIIFSRVQLTGTATYQTNDVHKPADGSEAGVSVLIDKDDVTGSPVFDTFNLFAKLGTGSEFLFATTGVNIDFGGPENRKVVLTVLLEITESEQAIFEYSGGDDAYQIAVQQGYEGTAQEWLQSLIGPQGERGPQGIQGPKGDKGNTGDTGPKGDTGKQGIQGIQGPKGDKGDTGDKGDQGLRGLQGIQGPQGDKGDTGDQGIQGTRGPEGPQGEIGPKGDKGDTGDTGPRGLLGPEGPQGEIGPRGPQGEIGPEGPKGDKGDKGDQGIQGEIGPRGVPGEIESLHSTHIEEALGYLPLDPTDLTWTNLSNKPATFAPSAHSHSWAQITGKPTTFAPSTHSHAWADVTNKPTTFPSSWAQVTGKPTTFAPTQHTHDSSEITNLPDLTGPKGDKGDTGDQGIQGPKGDKGDTGEQGIQGPKGDKGDTGEQGIRGPEGPEGPQGERGPKGDTGEQGIQGPEGPKGADADINQLTKSDVGLSNVDNVKQMPISNGVLENYREKLVTVTASGGSINLSLGNVFQHTPSGNTTYTISNAVSGQAHSFTLIINMGGTVRTLTFPASVKWQGGEVPDMTTANNTYVSTFMSVDGGTTWLGMFGGEF